MFPSCYLSCACSENSPLRIFCPSINYLSSSSVDNNKSAVPICENHFKFAEHYSTAFGFAEANGFLKLSKQVVYDKHMGCGYKQTSRTPAGLAEPVSELVPQHQCGLGLQSSFD